jgi:ssDNA-binding Zn-finger/Zn-ribbon topoisomerase 1
MATDRIDQLLADPTIESLFEARPNVEDVTFETLPARFPGMRHDLLCGECAALMQLRESPKFPRPFYGCTRYPECKGTHGAHADGTPLGRPANKETKIARMRAHAIFDQIWKLKLVTHRGAAYNWMRQVMQLSHTKAHIAMFDLAQCDDLIRLVYRDYPNLKGRYARLIFDEDPFGLDVEVD